MPASPAPRPSLWQRLLRALGIQRSSGKQRFELDQNLAQELRGMARRERRAPDELAADLLGDAIRQHQATSDLLIRWRSLSPREQEVAALICLGYTYPEIAAHLNIAVNTVKSHSSNLLRKFDLRSRHALRVCLADWDFSAWERRGAADKRGPR